MAMKTDANPKPGRISLAEEGLPQGELQLVGFHVGGEEFALDILRVQEIIRLQELTRVPNSNESMDGVMNLRGKIIPVVALRKRFGLEQVPANKQNRIVVVEIRGAVLGLIVDSVSEVLRLPAGTVEAPPRLSKVKQEYVSGVGKLDDRLLILLDVDRLLTNDDLPGTTAAQA
jgi:purine-binding chemotaxis protein CheW